MKTTSHNEATLQQLSEKLDRIEALTLIGAKNVLDLDEAVLLTGYSKGHLYRLTCSKAIPHFKKDRKLFFRKSELEDWLTDNHIPTTAETQAAAQTYCSTHQPNF